MTELEAWGNFYVIVGSSAGALTGLQFVVMSLISDSPALRGRGESISAFGTPNVVHFCAALLVAAILSIPWNALGPAGISVAGCGVLGVVYTAIVTRRALRQRAYEPVFEDWLWHAALPAVAYAMMMVAGGMLGANGAGALFVIGPATLLLVFVGIHNAWDTVTFVTMQRETGESPGSTPMPTDDRTPRPLSEALVGTWELLTREDRAASGERRIEPSLGADPIALVVYDRTGHFTAQFMRRDRSGAPDAPVAVAASNNTSARGGYDAYFGSYAVDDVQGTVTARLIGALSPENVGLVLTRAMTVVGDELTIRLDTTTAGGEPITRTLKWRRLG